MNDLTRRTNKAFKSQESLLSRLSEKIANKQKDLDDLKEENDLSEQGIYLAPKPFKSVSAENQALESLKIRIDDALKDQNKKITELETLYAERKKKVKDKNDPVNAFYEKTLVRLKAEQAKIIASRQDLMSNLDSIKTALDFERKRRIRKAAFDNQQDRYNKDKAALSRIKQSTSLRAEPYTEADFDFGQKKSNNIQIVKNILNEKPGYYMVIAVHTDVNKRDDFVTKVVESGEKNINFFFDVNTNKYFMYVNQYSSISAAKKALQEKSDAPYNSQMSLVKIDN
jgi:uncharacterized coiled-coil protein SlyX